MRDRTPLLVLVAVLAVLGVRYLPPYLPSESKPATKEGGGQAPRPEPGDNPLAPRGGKGSKGTDFLQPLLAFLNEPAKPLTHPSKVFDTLRVKGYELEFLIVTLPDPVDSSSGWRFDAHVGAVQRAVETQGFVLDRFWYPWGENTPPKSSAPPDTDAPAKGEDGEPKQPDAVSPRLQESQPGVLLFRPVPQPPKPEGQTKKFQQTMAPKKNLQMVFLVGETATQGVHKEAFTKCLRFIQRSPSFSKTKTVRILGPAFSGSRRSLEIAISRWCKDQQGPTVKIISGSATGINKADFEAECRRGCPGAVVTFQATVHPESLILGKLFEYCKESRVAILTETNTAFGQTSAVSARERNVLLPFPLQVSDVRTAYNKGAKGEAASGLPVFGTKLPIPLEESGNPRDTEPSLTPAMTEVANEQILNKLLGTISQMRIRYVLISATELKDKIFLANKIRESFPDVQLLLSGSDQLLTHPNVRGDLKGTIVASSYPLYLKNQHWSWPAQGDDKHLLFPGQQEQGYYNAAVALLAGDDAEKCMAMLEYGRPLGPPCDDDKYRPPVWVSILGQDGPHPLYCKMPTVDPNVIPNPDGPQRFQDYVFGAPAGQHEQGTDHGDHVSTGGTGQAAHVSHHTSVLLIPLILFTLFLAMTCRAVVRAFWWPAPADGTTPAQSEWVQVFRSERDGSRFRTFLCLAPLAVVALYLAATCLILPIRCADHTDWTDWLAATLSWVSFLGVTGVSLAVVFEPGLRRLVPFQWNNLPAFGVPILLAIVLVAAAVPAGGVVSYWWAEDKAKAVFFVERAGSLASGVTPVLPLLFLGLAFSCWGYTWLKRHHLLAVSPVQVPFPDRGHRAAGIILTNDQQLNESLRHPLGQLCRRGSSWAAAVFLGFALLRLLQGSVWTADGYCYDISVMAGFAVFSFLLVGTFLFARLLWKQLHALLRQVVLLPMAAAYDRLPTTLSSLFGPYLSAPRPSRQASRFLRLQQLSAVVSQFACCRAELKTELSPDEADVFTELDGAVGEKIARSLREQRLGLQDSTRPGAAPDWEEVLRDAAHACLRALAHFWAARPLDEAFASKPPGKEEAGEQADNVAASARSAAGPQQPEPVRQWVRAAEDFVAVEVVNYLSRFFVHFRNLVTFLTIGALLLLLAVVSYPFQPQRLLLVSVGGLILILAGGAFWTFLQMERDELVSRVLKTTPNRVSFHPTFLTSVATYVLPLLGVLALLYSDLSDLLHNWLDPFYKLIK